MESKEESSEDNTKQNIVLLEQRYKLWLKNFHQTLVDLLLRYNAPMIVTLHVDGGGIQIFSSQPFDYYLKSQRIEPEAGDNEGCPSPELKQNYFG